LTKGLDGLYIFRGFVDCFGASTPLTPPAAVCKPFFYPGGITMNELVKVFEGRDIRILDQDGQPWFVGKDVCEVLGYANHNKAMIDHCKGVTNRYTLATDGGNQDMRVINESDLYRLIIRSNRPEAVQFEKWIMEEVLPSIRKNGGYLSTSVDFTDPENIQKLLDGWKKDRAKLIIAESRIDRLVHNTTTYTTTEIAKELGFKSAQALNDDLKARGIHYKDSRGVWVLYAEYAGKGLQNIKQKEVNGYARYYSEWTGLGRDWLNGLYRK
jgi:anti-repressor protein